jgi:hypothetical protein
MLAGSWRPRPRPSTICHSCILLTASCCTPCCTPASYCSTPYSCLHPAFCCSRPACYCTPTASGTRASYCTPAPLHPALNACAICGTCITAHAGIKRSLWVVAVTIIISHYTTVVHTEIPCCNGGQRWQAAWHVLALRGSPLSCLLHCY